MVGRKEGVKERRERMNKRTDMIVKHLETSYTANRNVKWYRGYANSMENRQKIKNGIPVLGI